MTAPLVRGQVVLADIGLKEAKRVLVVSNNRRNANLHSALAVRLTTSPKPDIPSIVRLDAGDNLTGVVVCDDIIEIYDEDVISTVGALSQRTMARINLGLAAALGMS